MAGPKSYYELLKHPKWQRKRLEIMEEHDFKCEHCGADDQTLQIHHSYYAKGMMPWDYPNESLHCLCEECHQDAQDWLSLLHRQIGALELSDVENLLGYARGLEARNCPLVIIDVPSYATASGVGDAYQLTAEEVIRALHESRIDGYTLDAMNQVKHGGRGWVCGICGMSAGELFLSPNNRESNPYDSLEIHVVDVHGLDRSAVDTSRQTMGRDGYSIDGHVWMRLIH